MLPLDIVGWREAASRIKMIQQKISSDESLILVAQNCEMALEIAFELQTVNPVYVLDYPSNIKNGRFFQHHLWGTDKLSLKRKPGSEALIIVDDTVQPGFNHREWCKRLCKMFQTVRLVDELRLLDHWKHFLYFHGENLRVEENYQDDPALYGSCDFPPFGSLDTPKSDTIASGLIVLNG